MKKKIPKDAKLIETEMLFRDGVYTKTRKYIIPGKIKETIIKGVIEL